MDTITQGLLGATAVQTGLRQKIGRDASWVAFIAALLPDLDIIIAPIMRFFGNGSPMDMMVYHRSFTHALLAIPLIAFIPALPWWLLRKRKFRRDRRVYEPTQEGTPPRSVSFRLLYLCCLVAVATHALLDACTSYGTQLLWPFSNSRIAWDCVGIIDPFYSFILIFTLLGCYILRKIFRKSPARSRRVTIIVGIVGMVLSTGYLVAGRVCHDIALNRGRAGLENRKIISANAYPMVGSLMLWRVVVETPEEWVVSRVHLLADPAQPLPRNTAAVIDDVENPLIKSARENPQYDTFAWFANNKLRPEIYTEKDLTILDFHDMRYGMDASSVKGLWLLRFVYGPDGELLFVGRAHTFHRRNRIEMLKRFWNQTWKSQAGKTNPQ